MNSATGDIGWQSAKRRRVSLCNFIPVPMGCPGRGAATRSRVGHRQREMGCWGENWLWDGVRVVGGR